MKFEVVEQPGWDALGDHADDHAEMNTSRPDEDGTGASDPLTALKAGTARLASDIKADAQQISESVAQMADLAGMAAAATVRKHGPTTTRPPAGFRAGRFSGTRKSPDVESAFQWPSGGTGSID
ncbi:hypothetical protein [Actinomadura alba]|uniref:Uncharacterized protein n=1 Tax=Actinomadura alba TaxID=406431 RepID=A0ABR7LMM3_9ACTN|nr:hypothetical protein [Actinomadura alba]MBC6466058.1 hypothetical protein [Actinomadura alba]